jgi:hypothetical protein
MGFPDIQPFITNDETERSILFELCVASITIRIYKVVYFLSQNER